MCFFVNISNRLNSCRGSTDLCDERKYGLFSEAGVLLSLFRCYTSNQKCWAFIIFYLSTKIRTVSGKQTVTDLKVQDKIPCSEIRKRTKIIDIIEYTPKQKRKWAGHIA